MREPVSRHGVWIPCLWTGKGVESLHPLLVTDRRWLQKWLAVGRNARESTSKLAVIAGEIKSK